MAFWNRRKPQPVTAAVINTPDTVDEAAQKRVTRGSSEAWCMYRQVGEIHYGVTQQARLVGRLDWTMVVGDEETEADEALDKVFGNDLRNLQVTMAIHLQVAAAFALARIADEWQVLPFPLDHRNKKLAEQADILITCENPDPQNGEPDSPVIAALPVARELLLARTQARTTARSRIAQTNTVLYPAEGAGPDPEQFEKDIQEVMTAPMADETSTSVAVPNLIRWPSETIENWRLLDLTGPIDERLDERIDRLVRQLAIILDLPPTLLLGNADSNHWVAWADAEDNFLGHVEPLAVPIGRVLAQAVARISNTDPNALDIKPDPAPLLKRRPSIADVLAAHQQGIVSSAWAREQLGATPDDAATETEVDPIIQSALDLARGAPALVQNPGLPALVAQLRAVLKGGPVPDLPTGPVTNGDTQPAPARIGPATSEPATEQRPVAAAAPRTVDGHRLSDIDYQVQAALQDLIDDTSDRILERLGAVIRSSAQKRDIELPPVPNAELPRHYTGDIPNRDTIIDEEARKAMRRVDRIINRAYGRLQAMGIDVEVIENELDEAREQFVAATRTTVETKATGPEATGEAEAWTGAKLVAAVAAGVAAASALGATGFNPHSAIASGPRVMQYLQSESGLRITGRYEWDHQYQGANPHPQHLAFNGQEFDGLNIYSGGTQWFPGDHYGCQCDAAVVLERTS